MRISILVAGLLLAGGALAEPDTFGLGSGRSGTLRVDSGTRIVNRYAPLTASVAAGTRDLTLPGPAASGFSAGELVLLHQSTGLTPMPASGDSRLISLQGGTTGRFEYARVETVLPSGLRLTAPLLNGYPAGLTQVVSVPEYTDVDVRSGATLQAAAWDGSVGGILALLVSGRLRNDGLVTVAGAGLRGGSFANHPALFDCWNLETPVAQGGSSKGEGLVAGSYGTASGRGNLANAGGGGNCHNSGGGGGGHAGAGGNGGRTSIDDNEREVGGLGGAALTYPPHERLVFGGGGGAGEGNNNAGSSGGAGGGVMLLRALEVRGIGAFRANGLAAPDASADDGAGGGGAGGAISVRAEQRLECGSMEALGGAGGNVSFTQFPLGPGGGGGGGVIFMQTPDRRCAASVTAGKAGQAAATGDSHGAGPSSVSTSPALGALQVVSSAFRLPAAPTLTLPVEGATEVSPRPRIQGSAEPGARVLLLVDGVAQAWVQAGADGAFSFDVAAALAPGPRELSASAEVLGVRSPLSALRHFSVLASVTDGGVEPPADGGDEPPLVQVPPVLVVPAEGERVGPMPLFNGTATHGLAVAILVDELEVAQVPIDAQGRFSYVLTAEQALAPGTHHVTVHSLEGTATVGPESVPTAFEVGPPLQAGCGCGATSGLGAGAGFLLLGVRALRRRGAP